MTVNNSDNNENDSMNNHPTDRSGDRGSTGSRNVDDIDAPGNKKRTKRSFYHQLETIAIQFAPHWAFPHLHEGLNSDYAFYIDFEELLNPGKNNFKDAPNVVSDILAHAESAISPEATHTTDKTIIAPLLQACVLKVKNPTNNFFTLRNAPDLEKAIRDLIRENGNSSRLTLPLYLNIHKWYLDRSKPCDPLNFALVSLTPFPTSPAPALAAAEPWFAGSKATSERQTKAKHQKNDERVDELIQLIENSGDRPFRSAVEYRNRYINGEVIEREQTETEFNSYIWKLLDAATSKSADNMKLDFPLACMISGSGGGKTTMCRLLETSLKSRIQDSINEYLESKNDTTVTKLSVVFATLNNECPYSTEEKGQLHPATSLGIRLVAARYGWTHLQVNRYLRGPKGATPYEDARKYNGISLECFLRKLNPNSEEEAVIVMIDEIWTLEDDAVDTVMLDLSIDQYQSLRDQMKKFTCVTALTTKPPYKLINSSQRPVTPISLPPVSPREVLRQARIFADRVIKHRKLDQEKHRHHLISQFCTSGGTFMTMSEVAEFYREIPLENIASSFYKKESSQKGSYIEWGRHILRISVFDQTLCHTDQVLDDEDKKMFNYSTQKNLLLEDLILGHKVVVTKSVPSSGLAVMVRIPTTTLNALATQWNSTLKKGETNHLRGVMQVLEYNRQFDGSYSKIFEEAIMHVLCLRLSLKKGGCQLGDTLPYCEFPNKAMSDVLEKEVQGGHCRWVKVERLDKAVVKKECQHGTMVFSELSNEKAVEGFWCLTVDGKPFYILLQMKFWGYYPPAEITKWESAIHRRAKAFGLKDGDYVPLFFSTSEKFSVKSSLAMPKKASDKLLEPFGVCPMMLYAEERYKKSSKGEQELVVASGEE